MKTSKKSMLMLGLVVAAALGALGSVAALARHEPAFYRNADVPPPGERGVPSVVFLTKVNDILECFKEQEADKDPVFQDVTFDARIVNGFLNDDTWNKKDEAATLARNGISEPRISFDKDRMRLGFRYRNAFMTTIISIEMRVWQVPTEVNTFAIEILNRRAGCLPFPTHALLEEISNLIRKQKIEVNWYRHKGHPVALVRLQNNGPRPNARIQRFDLEPGKLTIAIAPAAAAGQAQNQNRPNSSPLQPDANPRMIQQQASPTPPEE